MYKKGGEFMTGVGESACETVSISSVKIEDFINFVGESVCTCIGIKYCDFLG